MLVAEDGLSKALEELQEARKEIENMKQEIESMKKAIGDLQVANFNSDRKNSVYGPIR